MGKAALSLLLLSCVGCTSMLARIGDPDLSVLRRGASRAAIEEELDRHPKELKRVEDGRYVALYIIKLGAPKNEAARGESLESIGKGAGATLASNAFGRVVNRLASNGSWSGSDAAAAAVVGVAVWGASEFAGTVRELARLSGRRRHQLEVVYDHRDRMLTHQLLPLAGGRLPDQPMLVHGKGIVRARR